MQIEKIEIRGLRSHHNTSIEGLARVNWFVGQNRAGKSTILDAVQFALTGVCRGLDEAGRGAEALITDDKQKAPRFNVRLVLPAGNIERRGPGDGPKSTVQNYVDTTLGRPGAVSRAVIDTGRFLALPTAEQKNLLTSMLGATIARADVAAELGDAAATLFDWSDREEYGPKDFDAIEKQFRDVRPQLKQRLAAVAPTFDPKAFPADLLQLTSKQAEGHLAEAVRQSTAAAAAVSKGAREIGGLEATIRQLTQQLDEAHAADEKIANLASDVTEYEKLMKNEVAGSNAVLEGAWAADLLAVPALPVSHACPVCARDWKPSVRDSAIARLEADAGAETARREKLEKYSGKLVDARNELDRMKKAQGSKIRTAAELSMRQAEIEKAQGEQVNLTTNATALARKVSILQAYVSVKSAAEQTRNGDRAIDERRLRDTEKIIEAFGPNGLRVRLVTERMGSLVDGVNALLQPVGLVLSVWPEPFTIQVNGRAAALLSQSEMMVVGVAFQVALARLTGVPIICIDGVDILDQDLRRFLSAVLDEAAETEQFFISCTLKVPDDDFTAPPIPGWKFYLVRANGGVSIVVPR